MRTIIVIVNIAVTVMMVIMEMMVIMVPYHRLICQGGERVGHAVIASGAPNRRSSKGLYSEDGTVVHRHLLSA
jgi:hypothetical protein